MTYLKQISFACFPIPSDLVELRIITMLAQMRFPWEMVSKRSFAWEVYTQKKKNNELNLSTDGLGMFVFLHRSTVTWNV